MCRDFAVILCSLIVCIELYVYYYYCFLLWYLCIDGTNPWIDFRIKTMDTILDMREDVNKQFSK